MDFGLFDDADDDDDEASALPLYTASSNVFACVFSYALDETAVDAASNNATPSLPADDVDSAPKMFRCRSTDGDGGATIASSLAELPVIFRLFSDSGSYGSSGCGSTRLTAACRLMSINWWGYWLQSQALRTMCCVASYQQIPIALFQIENRLGHIVDTCDALQTQNGYKRTISWLAIARTWFQFENNRQHELERKLKCHCFFDITSSADSTHQTVSKKCVQDICIKCDFSLISNGDACEWHKLLFDFVSLVFFCHRRRHSPENWPEFLRDFQTFSHSIEYFVLAVCLLCGFLCSIRLQRNDIGVNSLNGYHANQFRCPRFATAVSMFFVQKIVFCLSLRRLLHYFFSFSSGNFIHTSLHAIALCAICAPIEMSNAAVEKKKIDSRFGQPFRCMTATNSLRSPFAAFQSWKLKQTLGSLARTSVWCWIQNSSNIRLRFTFKVHFRVNSFRAFILSGDFPDNPKEAQPHSCILWRSRVEYTAILGCISFYSFVYFY